MQSRCKNNAGVRVKCTQVSIISPFQTFTDRHHHHHHFHLLLFLLTFILVNKWLFLKHNSYWVLISTYKINIVVGLINLLQTPNANRWKVTFIFQRQKIISVLKIMLEGSIKEIHEVGHIQLQATFMKLIDFFLPRLEFQQLYQHFICYPNK